MTDFPPILSEHDILRLATGLGMGVSAFVQRFVVKDKDGDLVGTRAV